MPNLREKTWTPTTPALTEDAQFWEDHLISDVDAANIGKAYLTDDTTETTLDDSDYVPFYDVSASAKRKTLWSNVKAKLKTYFDTIYTKKVNNPTNGNFAGLDSNGNLTDSGKKASDFMASNGVTANPTGTATGTLTSIGINGDKYDIQGGGGTDENAYHIGDTAETALADDDYFPFYDTSASAKRKTLWSNIKSVLSNLFAKKTDIAPIENGTTASRAYAVGQQFYLSDGKLYKCKQPIAQGATFTIGTNCELTDCVTEQLRTVGVNTGVSGVSAYKSGNVVTLILTANISAGSAGWYKIGTLVSILRPKERLFITVSDVNTDYQTLFGFVDNSGDINVYLYNGHLTANCRATITYVL